MVSLSSAAAETALEKSQILQKHIAGRHEESGEERLCPLFIQESQAIGISCHTTWRNTKLGVLEGQG